MNSLRSDEIIFPYLDNQPDVVIITMFPRWCWNWQTGMVEGHVPQGVEVQVLSSALRSRSSTAAVFFIYIASYIALYDILSQSHKRIAFR
jgi:hypothetical protein